MSDGSYGGGDEPGQAEERTCRDEEGEYEQVEVIAVAFLWAATYGLQHLPCLRHMHIDTTVMFIASI